MQISNLKNELNYEVNGFRKLKIKAKTIFSMELLSVLNRNTMKSINFEIAG